MKRITLAAVVVLLTLTQAGTFTQGSQPPTIATDITAAEVQAVINAPTGGGDRQMKVVDMGKYNVSVGVLHRGKTTPGAPVGATRMLMKSFSWSASSKRSNASRDEKRTGA